MPESSHKPKPPAIVDLLDALAVDAWPETLKRLSLDRFLDATGDLVQLFANVLRPSDPAAVDDMIAPLVDELRARARELRTKPPTGNA